MALNPVAPFTGSVDWNINPGFCFYQIKTSLPSQGAWIEMVVEKFTRYSWWSLPSQGAWIEMVFRLGLKKLQKVAPFTGSVDWNRCIWIKNLTLIVAPFTGSVDWNGIDIDRDNLKPGGRSLHRERGLKYRMSITYIYRLLVAPFTGSVDWNIKRERMKEELTVAPFTGSVDWNIVFTCIKIITI